MPQTAQPLDAALFRLRIFYGIILAAAFMQMEVAETFAHQTANNTRIFYSAFLLLAFLDVGVAFLFRQRKNGPAIERLRDQPGDRDAIRNLTTASILSVVLAESVVLYGFALRFLGGTRSQAIPFYLAGVLLMLLWWPKRP